VVVGATVVVGAAVVVGATVVVTVALWFHHGLSDHRPEAPAAVADEPTGSVARATRRPAEPLPEPEPA